MHDFRAGMGTPRRLPLVVCALIGLLVPTLPADAQEDGNPLRFLKPWIERQLFGRETSAPAGPAAPVPDEAAPPPGGAEPDPALPPAEAASEPAAAGETAAAPAAAQSDTAPAADAAAAETLLPQTPVAGALEALPDPIARILDDAQETKPEPLRFAVLAGRDVAATMTTLGPVAEELAMILGRPVEILPLASYDAMIDAQAQRRIDGGFYSAAAFAAADASCMCLEPVVAPKASDGTLAYHAVIVARADAGIASPADLVGKTVAIGAADSIGARRMQLAGLLAEGVDPATTFGAVVEAGSTAEAVRLVAAGGADAAFAWSSLAGSVEGGYSRGTLTELAGGGIALDSLAVIWRSLAIAHGPFAVMRTLSEEDKGKLEDYLAALSAANPAAYDRLDPFYGGGYAPVDPRDYSGVETLLGEDVDAVRLPAGPATTGTTTTAPGDVPPLLAPPPN